MKVQSVLFLLLTIVVCTTLLPAQNVVDGSSGSTISATHPSLVVPKVGGSVGVSLEPSVVHDPLNVKIYTLNNGLTVMISVNKAEPRLQTMIAVRAGSKNDPADNTGLAHYLEHLLFKGTDRYGTKDFAAEKVLLDKIESLYEEYHHTTNTIKRTALYRIIDSISGEAAKYAIANEYDKMVGAIGAKETNAFTSNEQTVYVNDIPQNQLEKWMMLESERFRNPVFRLFHTELEAVYEEKNIGLDNDGRKVIEALMAGLFSNHGYGTQTTIGTVEHLKNPSLKKIWEYYNTYYVPNNMAIILSGDLDPERTKILIEKYFGQMQPKPVPSYSFKPETPRTEPLEQSVYGPDAENLVIGFRFPGVDTHEADLLAVADLLLAYKTAGLIDLNLKKSQKVLDASSNPQFMKDYSIHVFRGKPKQGQSLEEVRSLLLQQIEKLKNGEFDEASLQAVVRNLKVDQMNQYESNTGRSFAMLDAFITGQDWVKASTQLDRLSLITKKDVVEFARKHYGNDYVVIYKRQGEDKDVVKVEKPEITPVTVNREDQSPFVKAFMEVPAPPISPAFIDYNTDITRFKLRNGTPVYSLQNKDNGLFSLYYVFEMGKNNNRKLPFAITYLQYLGTNTMSAQEVAREFFRLGCEFNVSSSDDQVYVSLSGLDESFDSGLKVFEDLLANVKPDRQALMGLIDQEFKGRTDAKLNKRTILWSGLRNYATYGKNNPFTDRLSTQELGTLDATELTNMIKSLNSYAHKVLYYGPRSSVELKEVLNTNHRMPETLKPVPPATEYVRNETNENVVYFVNYDMVQAEVVWLNKSKLFDPAMVPVVSMFNEYFGGGMSSVVFQSIRESKALAYSTFSFYQMPRRKEDPFYVMAYVGTQADKLSQAVPAMNELLDNMPRTEQAFMSARKGLKNQIETERIIRADVLFDYLSAERKGVDHDLRRDVYTTLDKLSLDDLEQFHKAQYENKPFTYCILGSKEKVNMDELKKYGRVVELRLEDVFGY